MTRLQPSGRTSTASPGREGAAGPSAARPPACAPPTPPLTSSPSGGRVRPLARLSARRPRVGCARPGRQPTLPRSSGPALCDTAHQLPVTVAEALQSAREGRGLAFQSWRLLGCRGRTSVLEGLSVIRNPDVDPLLLTAAAFWGKAGGGDRSQSTGRAGARLERLGWGNFKVLWG